MKKRGEIEEIGFAPRELLSCQQILQNPRFCVVKSLHGIFSN